MSGFYRMHSPLANQIASTSKTVWLNEYLFEKSGDCGQFIDSYMATPAVHRDFAAFTFWR
jgi:hypothetical protein